MKNSLALVITTYAQWCRDRKTDHPHCPLGCDHPQDFMEWGQLYCGCCLIMNNFPIYTVMVPCGPKVCN